MELLEYQAKQLFDAVGIPTLPSQIISDARELKQLQIPYPVVLKSQVRAGGRGKAGGIKRVQNTIDAIAAARNIFNLAIAGQYPDVLLVEAHYAREKEIFLAVVLDYELQRPVLLGSAYGGMEVDRLLANLHQVVIEEFFSPFHARHLLNKMDIHGEIVPALSDIIKKMYDLLLAKDLELVEINPLGINQAGELMALDGKVTVHDTAIRKHPEIAELSETLDEVTQTEGHSPLYWEDDTQGGNIAIVCYGVGSAALIWDWLHEMNGNPACCWILGPRAQGRVFSPYALDTQIEAILTHLKRLPQVDVLLLNLVAEAEVNQQILQRFMACATQPQTVVNRAPFALDRQEQSATKNIEVPLPEIVVRCLPMVENTFDSSLHWETNLEDALQRAIALGKQKQVRS